jgi:hypothetical protein
LDVTHLRFGLEKEGDAEHVECVVDQCETIRRQLSGVNRSAG